jgi:glucokinase
MSVVLADLGGTYLRLSRRENPTDVCRFAIADHENFTDVVKNYAHDVSAIYLASAVHPRSGVIEDRRFGDKAHWLIDLAAVKQKLTLEKIVVLNDLEAAAYGLSALKDEQTEPIVPAKMYMPHFTNPPKLLIGIGTGIGHAYLIEKAGHGAIVQRSHGGHFPVPAITDEQNSLLQKIRAVTPLSRDVVFEDIVSGRGFEKLAGLYDAEYAGKFFAEFLGLYINVLVSAAGAYGGVYLTGGVTDEMMLSHALDTKRLEIWFRRPMLPVVEESLASTPLYYVLEKNLPLAGLACYSETA